VFQIQEIQGYKAAYWALKGTALKQQHSYQNSYQIKEETYNLRGLPEDIKKGFIFLMLPEVQLEGTSCNLKKRQNEFATKGEKD